MSVSQLRNLVVVAGAGTGKTRALVREYLMSLLGLDGSGVVRLPTRVCAITFTDKAAAEMRSRVQRRLVQLVRHPDGDAEVSERAATLGMDVPDSAALQRILRHLAGAPIATFHALSAGILRELALDVGLDPGFALMDAVDEKYLLEEIAESVTLDALTDNDEDVAELVARFSLRRAGGQAKGIVEGLVAIYGMLGERGLRPSDLVDTSNGGSTSLGDARGRVAEAMRAAVDALQSDDRARFAHERIATLTESWATLRDALDDDRLDRDVRIRRAAGRMFREDGDWGPGRLREVRDALFGALQDLLTALADGAQRPWAAGVRRLLVALGQRVEQEKNARSVLGFSDVLLRLRDILRSDPKIRARVKARFDRILVDEYQDTSPVQEDLVALLAEEPTRGDRLVVGEQAMGRLVLAPGRLFVVGDPKQSIYGFRGADPSLFLHTQQEVTEGPRRTGEVERLTTNYRSRAPILELTNALAEATLTEAQDPTVAFTSADRLNPSGQRPPGTVAGALLRPIDRGEMSFDDAEAQVIADRIQRLISEGFGVDDDDRPCTAKDIVVLVRRIRMATPVVKALAAAGIRTKVTGGEGFFARPEVSDLICALRVLAEPHDELAVLSVLRSPLVGLSDDGVVALFGAAGARRGALSWVRVRQAAGAADLARDERERLAAFSALMDGLRDKARAVRPSALLDELIDSCGIVESWAIDPNPAEILANVDKLRALAEGEVGAFIPVAARLWSYLDAPPKESVATSATADVDAVRIMTIHQSKGLEFPIVFIADMGSALPPERDDLVFDTELGLAVSLRGRTLSAAMRDGATGPGEGTAAQRVWKRRQSRGLAELARLLYVAVTRARDAVFFVGEERRSQQQGSLRRLFEQARVASRGRIDALVPIERIAVRKIVIRPSQASPQVALPPADPVHIPRAITRIEPSHLAEDTGFVVAGAPEQDEVRMRRGRLAHHLLARVGDAFAQVGFADRPALRAVLDAEARNLAEDLDDPVFGDLRARLLTTLTSNVQELWEQRFELLFERPVRHQASNAADQQFVIQGTIDLLARRPNEQIIVDWKFSRPVDDVAALLQLEAYALAVERPADVVRLGLWTIGETQQRQLPFDDKARRRVMAAIARRLSTPMVPSGAVGTAARRPGMDGRAAS